MVYSFVIFVTVLFLFWNNSQCVVGIYLTNSPEFLRIAEDTYSKIVPCLEGTWTADQKQNYLLNPFSFPDDAEEHFEQIKNATAKYRTFEHYTHPSGYKGPYIEDIFIDQYMNKSLHTFQGLIPIFVQWLNLEISNGWNGALTKQFITEFATILRPSVIYLVVSWGDNGIWTINDQFPNIFTISSGGNGHLIAPELKGVHYSRI